MLYASDGTNHIYVLEKDTLKTLSYIAVFNSKGNPINGLNKLEAITHSELVKNYIFATQVDNNFIFLIDLRTGIVASTWDMQELVNNQIVVVYK